MPYGARVSVDIGHGVEYGCNYTHIRRGFCVAHSIGSGNARASGCGMGDGYRFPRFLLYMININQNYVNAVRWESAGTKIIYYEQVFVKSDVISDDDNVCVLVHCLQQRRR